jgi:hypothetical protein
MHQNIKAPIASLNSMHLMSSAISQESPEVIPIVISLCHSINILIAVAEVAIVRNLGAQIKHGLEL